MWHQANNVKYEHSHPFEPTWTAHIKHTEIFLFVLRIEIILKSPFRFWMTPNHSRQKISVPLNCFKGNNVWLRNLPFVAKCTFCAPLTKLPWNVQIQWNSYWCWMLQEQRKLFSKKVFKNSTKRLKSCFNEKCIWKRNIIAMKHFWCSIWNESSRIISLGHFRWFKVSKYICNNRAESGQLCNSCWFP